MRISGNIGDSCRASRRVAWIGAVPPVTIISMSASGNGRPPIPYGFGLTAPHPCCSVRSLAQESKLERGLVIAFALAEVLVQAGERVGVPDLMRPTGSRNVLDKLANAVVHDASERPSLPYAFAPPAFSEIVVLSDFWSPDGASVHNHFLGLRPMARIGHAVQIVDPAEESFPYSGRVEFIEPEGAGSITAGRAESWKPEYAARVARHRTAIRAETDRLGWSFTIHRTDRPATELLLAHARAARRPSARNGNERPSPNGGHACEAGMTPWLPLGFAQPLVLLALLGLPVLWWLLRLIPPQPRRISFPPTQLLFGISPKQETPRRTPWWLTLLRLTLAALVIIAAAGPLWNPPLATSAAKIPLALLIDDGFPAAGTWDIRRRTIEDLDCARGE